MHLLRIAVPAVIALGLVSATTRACEQDPFLFQLPGETEAEAHQRSAKIRADHDVTEHFNRERTDLENATLIYLARVVSRTPDTRRGKEVPPSARVRPLASFKGALPSTDRTLAFDPQPGACTDYGDGRGAVSEVGSLGVAFEGLPKTDQRPRGIKSFMATAIRTNPILDQLREYGKDLED